MTSKIEPQPKQKELSLYDDILETVKINLRDEFFSHLEQNPECIINDDFPSLKSLDQSLIYDVIPDSKGKMMSILVEIERDHKDKFSPDMWDYDTREVLNEFFYAEVEEWYESEVDEYFQNLADSYQDSLIDHAFEIFQDCEETIDTRDHIKN